MPFETMKKKIVISKRKDYRLTEKWLHQQMLRGIAGTQFHS
jgi:hypothetical protein